MERRQQEDLSMLGTVLLIARMSTQCLRAPGLTFAILKAYHNKSFLWESSCYASTLYS